MRLLRHTALILLATLLALPLAAAPLEWQLDGAHSYVGFKIRHLMVSYVRGQFTDASGKLTFDKDDLSTLKMDISIKTASIDTRNERRDNHLRSADFFDVEKYPEMKFISKSVKTLGPGKAEVTGDLTMHGATKPVTLELEGLTHVTDSGPQGKKTGATLAGTLSRKDWGLTWNRALEAGGVTVGDEVILEIEVELNHSAMGGGRSKKSGD